MRRFLADREEIYRNLRGLYLMIMTGQPEPGKETMVEGLYGSPPAVMS